MRKPSVWTLGPLVVVSLWQVSQVTAAEDAAGGASASKAPFAYRSVAFATPGRIGGRDPTGVMSVGEPFAGIKLNLNRDLLKLAARVGFNDLTIQTEAFMKGKMEALGEWAEHTGNFRFAKSLGMTISVWVREFQDWDENVGPLTVENEKLWQAISARYRRILTEILPEVDHLVLTVVESQVPVTKDPKLLAKLVTTVNDQCRAAKKKLILRSFVWHPEEMDVFLASLSALPKEVIIQSKCVPQDWHLRGVHNPVIGAMDGREEQIEIDIAGEYNKLDNVACAFTDILEAQLKYAVSKGVKGIAVRVDRYGHTVWGQAQEVNLWYLGYFGSGKSDDPAVAWKDYATATFGPKAAPAMIEALRPTGHVIAEAICVERESFGYSRDYVPAMRGGPKANPFFVFHSPARWEKSLQPTYEKILAGDPELIRRKIEAYAQTLKSADRSLALIDSVRSDLPEGAYPFFRWKLEENRYLLVMMCEAELAWLKSQRLRRSADQAEKETLADQVRQHFAKMEETYAAEGNKTAAMRWRGKTHEMKRGSYNDFMGWLKRFRPVTGL